MKHILQKSVEILGKRKAEKICQWFDQECEVATNMKHAAYKKTIEAGCTRRNGGKTHPSN